MNGEVTVFFFSLFSLRNEMPIATLYFHFFREAIHILVSRPGAHTIGERLGWSASQLQNTLDYPRRR